MTKLLEKVFKEASKLPELEQNVFAKRLLEELVSEKKWEKTFANSEDVLSKLANEAIKEYKQGKTELLSVSRL